VQDTSDAPEGVEIRRRLRENSQTVSDETDRRLLEDAANGGEQAFAELYQRHAPAVFNYFLRLIHDQNLAEDLLQDSFVALWQGAGTFKGQSQVKTWLFRIAHNKAVSWLRRHRPQSMQEDLEILDETPGPEALSLINWRNEALLSALDDLSPNQRAVIELAFVHELAYADIAQIMDCPLGTVKSRMSYALKHLYRLLHNSELG
jgi:RNA polymerase sigma-70 factor (ECF subfamily)